MNIFHIYYILVNSNKIPMCAGEIQWGYLFHFPARGQPSMTSNNDTSQVGGAAFLAIISTSFSLFRNLPTMCRIMSNSDKCLLLNDVKKYQGKKIPATLFMPICSFHRFQF